MKNKIILVLVLVLVGAVVIFALNKEPAEVPEVPFEPENNGQSFGEGIDVVSYSEKNELFDITVNYPQFELASEAFNDSIKEFVEDAVKTFKEIAEENWKARKEFDKTLLEYPETPFYFETGWRSAQSNENYISCIINYYSFSGGAHGDSVIKTFNFDVLEQEEISFSDFVGNSQENLNKIADLVKAELESQILADAEGEQDEILQSMIDEGASPVFKNYENFVFDENNLTVCFQKYQVAPGSFGLLEVEINKNELEELDLPYFE
jgi:hypothetical protein